MGKNGELLRSLADNKECSENKMLFDIEIVRGTPFNLLEKGGITWIRIGDKVCLEREFETRDSAKAYIELKHWDLISGMVCVYAQAIINLKDIKE